MARLMLVCLLLPLAAGARPAEDASTAGGAVLGPAVLPEGQTVTMAWVGVPEVGAAWRQGLVGGQSEVEARLQLDYLLLAATLEGFARRQFGWAGGHLVPQVGAGVVLDSGAQYVFEDRVPGVYLRLSPGLLYSRRVDDSRDISKEYIATFRVALPAELGVSTPGAWNWLFSAGTGLEHPMGRGLWFMGGFDFGVGPSRRPQQELKVTGFFQFRLGVGFRDD